MKLFCEKLNGFINSLLTKMTIENKSKNTTKAYSHTYKMFIEFCEQSDKELSFETLREDDIYSYISYRSSIMNKQGELSASTINSIVSHLKRLFIHIERNSNELLDFSKVFDDIKIKPTKKIPKGLSDKELSKLDIYIKDTINNPGITYQALRNILLLKLMLLGGLRASETLTIKLSDFIADGEFYKISFFGKGKKHRIVYVVRSDFKDELELFKIKFNIQDSSLIALTSNDTVMDRFQLSDAMKYIYKLSNIKVSGVHILRHTAAKRLLANNVNITVVQSILGHSSIQSTTIYTNPTEEIMRAEMLKVKL